MGIQLNGMERVNICGPFFGMRNEGDSDVTRLWVPHPFVPTSFEVLVRLVREFLYVLWIVHRGHST